MANWTDLKASIAEGIKNNGNQEITGAVLQNTLNSIVNAVGENATFAGIATPTTNPGVPDGPVFYFANEPGIYANFDGVELKNPGLAVLYNNINGVWNSLIVYECLQELGSNQQFPMSQLGSSKFICDSNTLSSFRQVKEPKNYNEVFYTSCIRNLKIILDKSITTIPTVALALFRVHQGDDGHSELRFTYYTGTSWEYFAYTDDIPYVEGEVSHFDKVVSLSGQYLGKTARIILDLDATKIDGSISSFVYGADYTAEPTFVVRKECIFMGDQNSETLFDEEMMEYAISKDFIRVGTPTYRQSLLTSAVRNIKVLLNEKQETLPTLAIGLLRKNYGGSNVLRLKIKLDGTWEFCFYSSNLTYTAGSVSHVDETFNYTGAGKPFSKIRVICDIDFDVIPDDTLTSFIYGSDVQAEPTYIINSQCIGYTNWNEERLEDIEAEVEASVAEVEASVAEVEASVAEVEASDSFVRIADATPKQTFYNGIVRNVKIDIFDENKSSTIQWDTVYLLLIRKNDTNTELWWGATSVYGSKYQILRDNVTPIEDINTAGYTHFKFTSNFGFTIEYDVDFNKVQNNISLFIYGDATAEPTYVLDVNRVNNSNKYRENVAAGGGFSFVPYSFGSAIFNSPTGVFDVKTPYLVSETNTRLSIFFEIFDNGKTGAMLGGLSIRLNFWIFQNGFSYYTPKAIYTLPINTPEIPIRLASDADGYVHIILGKDNTKWTDLGHAGNVSINIDKVYTNNKAKIKKDGWTVSQVVAMDETYETVTNVTSLIAPAVKDEVQADVLPVKPASFAVFGSSKSTTRQLSRDTGWIGKLLHGLFKRAGLVTEFTSNVMTKDGKVTGRRFFSNGNRKITGVGNYIEFETYGNALSIVQIIDRVTDYGVFNVYADDDIIGTFDNRNKTLKGTKTVTFEANGTQRSFFLPDLCSYNFQVKVGGVGKTCSMNPALVNGTTFDCYAVRTIMGTDTYGHAQGQVYRILYFPTAPTEDIEVTYEVGDIIAYAMSDYHTNNDGTDENTNPVYTNTPNGTCSYASGYPLMPMVCDERAVVRFNFGTYARRKIKIEIVDGVNPYFDFDFAVAEYNTLMNAAFGGYDVPRVINEGRWRDWRCLRYFFNPDKLFMEYGTNDDRYQIDRVLVSTKEMTLDELKKTKMKLVKTITKSESNLSVGMCTGTIQSITASTITSEDIKTSDIEVGDYLRIGEYHSSWREFVVRRVTAVDKGAGTVTWDIPFNPDTIWHYNTLEDMVGAQFAVRRLQQFKTNMQTAIKKFQDMLPFTKIYLVGMSAFRDNDYCSGWGYNECLQDLAKEFSCEYINISDEQIRFNEGALSDSDEIEITSTGSSNYTVGADSFSNQNREMRVLVNGVDVTGMSAYIDVKNGWYVKDDATIDDVELTTSDDWNDVTPFALDNAKGDVDIVFYKDIPTTSDQIKLICAKVGWSDDGVHQTTDGNITYSDSIIKVF